MHIHFLDPYHAGRSPIHQLDPRVKLVLAVAFILTASLLPFGAWPSYILLLALILSIELLTEMGIAYFLKRAFLALPFMLAALPLIFTVQGTPLATFTLGAWTFTISVEGVERVASIAFKSWVSVQMAIVLASTTSFPQLLAAMRALRIPKLLVAIFGLMWRYIFVLADEALRLLRARAARSGARRDAPYKTGGTLAWRARVTGGMAGSLLVRSFERGDRIYAAMAARGYDGETRTLPLPALQTWHWLVLGAGLIIYILIWLVGALIV
ncbi:MAG: Energy-coupling factor transporter transmembrane protein EcfT [Anaerolineae bacterium]|nr:Energy-coupling factor transporter transmembrane protein EcfT [Anaerolineae bacterium]